MYIHDPSMKLTFDHEIKFIGVLTLLPVQATLFVFDIVIPYFAHECITMGQCVTYIHNLCMTMTFGFDIKFLFTGRQKAVGYMI